MKYLLAALAAFLLSACVPVSEPEPTEPLEPAVLWTLERLTPAFAAPYLDAEWQCAPVEAFDPIEATVTFSFNPACQVRTEVHLFVVHRPQGIGQFFTLSVDAPLAFRLSEGLDNRLEVNYRPSAGALSGSTIAWFFVR